MPVRVRGHFRRKTRFDRRYVREYWHPAFGYFIGSSIVKKVETRKIRVLGGESLQTDIPLAFDADEALDFFDRRIPFAVIARVEPEKDLEIITVSSEQFEHFIEDPKANQKARDNISRWTVVATMHRDFRRPRD